MWDELDYIVPFDNYHPYYTDAHLAEAMDIIGRKRVPTPREQQEVHLAVEELLRGGIPETFRYSPASGVREQDYEVWPQKLLGETWDRLRLEGLTDGQLDNHDYPMRQAAGLTLMAILADVLAGTTQARITDRSLAYATIANVTSVTKDAVKAVQVVPLTLKGIAVDRLPLERLIEFRKREAREQGSDYRKLRHNYLEAVEKHIARISEVEAGSRDRAELDRCFEADMEDDLRDLKRELGFAKREAWLSKDILTLAVAGSGLLAAGLGLHNTPVPEVLTAGGAAALLGGTLGTGNKFAKARYDVLRKHPMAYLYEVGG